MLFKHDRGKILITINHEVRKIDVAYIHNTYLDLGHKCANSTVKSLFCCSTEQAEDILTELIQKNWKLEEEKIKDEPNRTDEDARLPSNSYKNSPLYGVR